MTGDAEVEAPVSVTTDVEKTDKELIAEEEKEAEDEKESKTDEEKNTKKIEMKEKKPTVFKKDWEEDKVYLFQSNRTPRIPSIVPKELLVESFLKLNCIQYENVNHNSRLSLKKSKLPFIEINGEEITDANILSKVTEKFGKNMSQNLTPEQLNIEHAMIKMVENHLYWAVINWRSQNVDHIIKAYKINLSSYLDSKIPPALLNLYFKMKIQKKTKPQGFHDLVEQAKSDMRVLSEMLGEKEFMFGAEPAMLDMTVFSILAQLLMIVEEVSCPLKDHLTENYPNLVNLVNRIKDKAWAEHWEGATGDSLDANPHIPKPEPIAEEEQVEEKKDEEKKVEKDEEDNTEKEEKKEKEEATENKE